MFFFLFLQRLEQTEKELRGLQMTCRDLIVRTAVCADAKNSAYCLLNGAGTNHENCASHQHCQQNGNAKNSYLNGHAYRCVYFFCFFYSEWFFSNRGKMKVCSMNMRFFLESPNPNAFYVGFLVALQHIFQLSQTSSHQTN